ncbi:gamma-glutamyl-gamma-aminobutyrate hydrolase family protein [Rubinisphaera italica]|uniref:Putative glutamine amidotransferase n=1 Tax=Rubinisphaera italica TaxID=2527969 RepID=A0A5C5XNL1_9PLAN|nr:gamma-glutamyl-gamma-aminobutyrate hydrolase family protein [Rubinisphaera italica]TWT64129.1 putative glutamine amidotransferase [Rubinisphaera italica]HBN79315.1 gamma-glutamyl-gamma-aminobutyrate hydrolase [Planctomycetaceae bacterium]
MTTKPIIGMNCDFRPARKDATALSWINTGYYDTITAGGGIPLIAPPYADDNDLKQFLNMVDGIVLTGCKLDLDPVAIGLEKHPATRQMPNRREDFDRRLAKMAYDLKIPVLAIGSGMQLMNVICGGTLFNDLQEGVARPLQHRDSVESTLRHVLEIVPGTRMDDIYGPGEIRVNSDHHMAVDQLAAPFKVGATTPDGIIEAYETISDDWFCLGVQFHPESDSASALDMQVIEAFMESCKEPVPEFLSFTQGRAA